MVDSMDEGTIDNSAASGGTPRHIYVHIPFCARICPYCAFYKERADPAQAARFCEAILAELRAGTRGQRSVVAELLVRRDDRASRSKGKEGFSEERWHPETIFFGGGTPTALTTAQLDTLLRGFHAQLDLSQL